MSVEQIEKEKMESIIRKIKKSLALANDKGGSADESDTAMLMAQKMMAKYSLSMQDIDISEEKQVQKNVVEGDGTEYTRLQWWMKYLATIVSENFKCYNFIRHSGGKTKAVFLGLEQDVEICKSVYDFAISAIKFHSEKYVKSRGISGDRATTIAVKNDYISGYLSGLKDKFKEQVDQEGWGLILVKDDAVVKRYDNLNLKSGRRTTRSSQGDADAQAKGYSDGKKFSHGRKGIEG